MNRASRILAFASGLVVVLVMLASLAGVTAVKAADTPPESITLETDYPVIRGNGVTGFSWNISIIYAGGTAPRVFDVGAKGPPEFRVLVQASDGTQVSAIRLDPAFSYGTSMKITAAVTPGITPTPGLYSFTFFAASGTIRNEIEVKANLQPEPQFTVASSTGSTDMYVTPTTETTAGTANHYSITVENTGTVPVRNVSFSSTKPDGWTITFAPEKISTLSAGTRQDVDVVITPPAKAGEGDYILRLTASADGTTEKLFNLRATVMSPNNWGWVGVGVIVLIVAGLVYAFMRLGKR